MSATDQIIAGLLEDESDEDEFDVKDVVEPGADLEAGKTDVKRYGRMKVVDTDRYTFLISYLTPVAYHDKVYNTYYKTLKQWSPTTGKHIHAWSRIISQSDAWKNDERNWEKSEYSPGGHYVRWPSFKRVRQAKITALFRSLMPTMQMTPRLKKRMYHVDPLMRKGTSPEPTWDSGHGKHHDSGNDGLPKYYDSGFSKFFSDFEPDDYAKWEWGSGLRDTHPHETGTPDEE